MTLTIPQIYPITDKNLARTKDHLSIIRELVRGGAQLIQIRDKNTPLGVLLPDLHRCIEFACKNNITLILNDRCDLVLSCNAMGVHLGQEDLPPEAARSILGPHKIIGFSTHSLRQVKRSLHLPVQYIGFGPIYRTDTKVNVDPEVGLERLRQVCRLSVVPVVAIGGIGIAEIRPVLEAGADSAAVISALMSAEKIALRMEQFLKLAEAASAPYRN